MDPDTQQQKFARRIVQFAAAASHFCCHRQRVGSGGKFDAAYAFEHIPIGSPRGASLGGAKGGKQGAAGLRSRKGVRGEAMRFTPQLLMFLAAAGALGSMAIHMFVPAFPVVAADLGSSPSSMQSALTIYLLGIGFGQSLAGATSDMFGRRAIMLGGVALFTLGSVAVALAQTIELLVAARVVQALGGAAALVAARTIVSDLSTPDRVAARVATLTTFVLISPALSPVIGGWIASLFGWRWIFWLLAALGAIATLFVWSSIGETQRGAAVRPSSLLSSYVRLLRNGRFRRFCLTSAAASSSLYIFLAGSSFLLHQRFGLTSGQAGLCYFLIASAAIVGTLMVRVLDRNGNGLRSGVTVVLAGGVLMAALPLAGVHSLLALLSPMLLVACGGGIAVPTAISGAMHAEEGLAGTGSSLAGALQMCATGLITTLAAQAQMLTPWAMPAGIFAASVVAFLAVPSGPLIVTSEPVDML